MKKILNKILVNHSFIYKLLLYVSAVILVVYLFPKGGQFKYEFQKGKPWQYDNYYAPFDFAIQKSDEEIALEKAQIVANSIQYFDLDEKLASSVKIAVKNDVESILAYAAISDIEKALIKETVNSVLLKIYEYGFTTNATFEAINSQFVAIKRGANVEEISKNKFFRVGQLTQFVSSAFLGLKQSDIVDSVTAIIFKELKPNVTLNESLTQKALDENISKIAYTKGLIAENQRIILRGDIVEGEKYAILQSLKSEFESQVWSKSNYNWIVFGYTILVALAFLMLLLFIKKYRLAIYENNTEVTFIFFNILLIVLLVTLIVKYNANYVYIVPIAILPLVLKAFFDARLGLFAHVLTVLLLGFIVPSSFEFIFLQIIAGIVTILTISELHKRANLFISVLKITFVYSLAFMAFSIIQEGNAQQLNWYKLTHFVINGGATLFVLPLIYIFEKMFGLVSDESLKELSNTNSKLLRLLAEKAPGTFQHSLQVANLAEACANEINANAMLVRTGALYHDIGKMENPMFFTENQSTQVNPHNDLTPKDSAKIIINHIIKGVELGKKYRLPDRIIDFIRTHHGTSLVYYFYKMEELSGYSMEDDSWFRYPGPIPFSKETAILMMCDAVEAASKSIKEPSATAYDTLIEKIVNKQMEEGQFMNADITFKELLIVKKLLKKKLKNIYHVRIEYPE